MPMASKSKSKQEEALEFLDDLDSFAAPDQGAPATKTQSKTPPPPAAAGQGKSNEAEVFAFIDEITQKSTEPTRTAAPIARSGTPTIRKSTERVRLGGGPVANSASSSTTSLKRSTSSDGSKSKETASPAPATASPSAGSWGWGSVWSTASAAIQTAKTAVDEQVKHLPANEQVRGWGGNVLEYAKSAQLDKLSEFTPLCGSASYSV